MAHGTVQCCTLACFRLRRGRQGHNSHSRCASFFRPQLRNGSPRSPTFLSVRRDSLPYGPYLGLILESPRLFFASAWGASTTWNLSCLHQILVRPTPGIRDRKRGVEPMPLADDSKRNDPVVTHVSSNMIPVVLVRMVLRYMHYPFPSLQVKRCNAFSAENLDRQRANLEATGDHVSSSALLRGP